MAINIRVATFCDDVRQEAGNKLSLMGLYADTITFGPGEGNFGLPKLCSVFIATGLKGVPRFRYRHIVSVNPPAQTPMGLLARGEGVIERPPELHAFDENNFVTFLIPIVFANSPSVLTADLGIEVEGQPAANFRYQVEVKRWSPEDAGLVQFPNIGGDSGSFN